MTKKPLDLTQPSDDYMMRNAVAWISGQGLPLRRVSVHQLKVGPWNFYPSTGTFNRDDLPKKQPGGFLAFQEALRAWWERETAPYRETL